MGAPHAGIVIQAQPDLGGIVSLDRRGRVSLIILGRLQVTDAAGREISAVVTQPKRLALLAYLALAGRDQYRQRDTVVALFWPEFDQPAPEPRCARR